MSRSCRSRLQTRTGSSGCQCRDRECIHVVFSRLRRSKNALVSRRRVSAQVRIKVTKTVGTQHFVPGIVIRPDSIVEFAKDTVTRRAYRSS
ncbi:unnamed protein product [Schistocephalus solidus]|uniref:40S ribosomal protein S11 n=1 Tax=Schistocephalus solidus TaxID=70667 RepID=A0A183TKL2_SCHSO|nr:unnamed protein product [Schistocephalus solidus]